VTDLIDKNIQPTVLGRVWSPPRAWAPWIAEARALGVLATPLILTQLAQMAIFTTDVIMLGRLSKTALASAAIGNTVFYFAWLIGGGPAAAVSPMIAHILGERAGNRGGVRASLRMGLWSVAICSLPMMVVLWFARPILLALHQDPVLAEGAGKFVGVLSFGLPFSLGYMVLRNFTTALGKPRAGLWVMALTIAFNALAGYALIFGHFGAPRLGIVGSGLATASSAAFSFFAMLAIIAATPSLRAYRMFRRFHKPVTVKLAEVFRLGLPIGLSMIFEAMLFNSMTLVMGTFGAVSLAAHQIAINIASITFMVPLGVGMASTVRVGLATGAGDKKGAQRAGLTAMAMGTGFITVCGVILALFGGPLASLYLAGRARSDLEVIAMAALFLKVAAAFQVFDALQVVAGQSLRGLKDARVPMLIAAGCYWLVGAPICLFLGLTLHMQGFGIWIGLAIALGAAAVALCARFAVLMRR
jgi:multidrug resistance protein, MATE family